MSFGEIGGDREMKDTDRWINIKERSPAQGERCIVWENRYKEAIFAYYIGSDIYGNDKFSIYLLWNEEKRIASNWWMPEPKGPKDLG